MSRRLELDGDLTLTHGPDRLRVRAKGRRVRVDLPSLGSILRLRRYRCEVPGLDIEFRWRGIRLATVRG